MVLLVEDYFSKILPLDLLSIWIFESSNTNFGCMNFNFRSNKG